jgi:hypothetical protein
MGMVIHMKRRRPTPPTRVFVTQRPAAPRFYACMQCDSALFRIFQNGLVRCAQCTAEIPNLTLLQR